MTKPIKASTPAEAARDRLAAPNPKEPVLVAKTAVLVPAAPAPAPYVVKTVVEELRELIAETEGRVADLRKSIEALQGHVGELANAILYSSGVAHAAPKIADAARKIAQHHSDKIGK